LLSSALYETCGIGNAAKEEDEDVPNCPVASQASTIHRGEDVSGVRYTVRLQNRLSHKKEMVVEYLLREAEGRAEERERTELVVF